MGFRCFFENREIGLYAYSDLPEIGREGYKVVKDTKLKGMQF